MFRAMWTYYPDLLSQPVPRYTSYPTAADFKPLPDAREHEAALRGIPAGAPVSLYVHIPFCEEICWYCGCNTARSNKRARLQAYLDALHQEIARVAALMRDRGRVTRISFGGGSPNALDPLDFVRLLGDLMVAFNAQNPLISLEIDPRRFSSKWLSVIASTGVRNVSLGVQSFDPAVQKAIGRVQPLELVQKLVADLRGAGVRSLNFDLMYGLPGQSKTSLLRTLKRTAELVPDRIALFGYAHLPAAIPRQRRIDATALPDARRRFSMACIGHDFFVNRGYEPVGFDHFARSGDPLAAAARDNRLHRNFQGFTDDDAVYLIGFGASAISEFPGLYVQNAKNAGAYRKAIAAGDLPGERGIVRDEDSRACGALINQILCHRQALLPGALTYAQHERLEDFARRGLISTADGMLRLKPAAMPYARSIAAIFDPRLAGQMGRFSAPV